MIQKASYTMKFKLSLYHYHVNKSHKIQKTYIYVFLEYFIYIFVSNMENTYTMSTLSVHTILLF